MKSRLEVLLELVEKTVGAYYTILKFADGYKVAKGTYADAGDCGEMQLLKDITPSPTLEGALEIFIINPVSFEDRNLIREKADKHWKGLDDEAYESYLARAIKADEAYESYLK